MTLTSRPLAALVVVILFGGIFFSSAMGWWQTESTKEAAKITSGEFVGQANPADIRGSYTFGDVEKNFLVPSTVLAEAFGVKDSNPAAYAVKGLEEMYAASGQEIGTTSVRLFVAFYKGMPYDLSTDIYLPESAAKILQTRTLSAEQAAYLAAYTVPNLASGTPQVAPQATSAPAAQSTPQAASSECIVKGSTTFSELLGWGVSQATIEKVLGVAMPAAPGTTVKDYSTEKGLSFETVKPALQAEVDKVK